MNKQTVHKAHKHIDDIDNGLPYRIRKIRENQNETMKEFGKKHFNPPASKGVVSNWENGYNKPNKKRLEIIAELGNISVEELVYGDNEEKQIGKRIKAIRQSHGFSQKEFGEKLNNANKSLVSRWENGRNLPNNERLKGIAEIADITVEELLYGDTYITKLELIEDLVNQAYEQIDKAHINIEKENKRIEKITLNLAEIKEIIINDLENN